MYGVSNPAGSVVQDEGVSQGVVDTFNFVGAGVSAGVSGSVATITIAGGGGGSLTITSLTAVYPAGTRDAIINVVDAAVTGTSKVILVNGHYTNTDENNPSDIYFEVTSVAAGSFNFRVQSKGPEAIKGTFRFFYFLG